MPAKSGQQQLATKNQEGRPSTIIKSAPGKASEIPAALPGPLPPLADCKDEVEQNFNSTLKGDCIHGESCCLNPLT